MKEKVRVNAGEFATVAINIFTEECMRIANENWSKAQVGMLQTLFESAKHGYTYKCVRCSYFGRSRDANQETQKNCMWEPSKGDGRGKPCEEEEERGAGD